MNFFGVDDLGKNAYIHIHRKRSRKTTDNEYRQTYLALVRGEVVLGPRPTDSCGKKKQLKLTQVYMVFNVNSIFLFRSELA